MMTVRGLLLSLAEILDQPVAERLLEAGEAAESPDDVRRWMNIGLREMNDALEALGRPPCTSQASTPKPFVDTCRNTVKTSWRSCEAGSQKGYRTTADLSPYTAARRFE